MLLSTVTPINATRCKYYHTARWHPGDCPSDMQANIRSYNTIHLPAVVAEYRARGHDIDLVVQPTNFEGQDYWIWGIHFNTTGFEKIAAAWYKGLLRSTPVQRRVR